MYKGFLRQLWSITILFRVHFQDRKRSAVLVADLYSGSSLNPLSKHLFAVVDIDTRTGRLIYSAAVQVEPQV